MNEAERSRVADCRVTRDGVPRPDDLAFRTQHLPAGDFVLVERVVPPVQVGAVGYDLEWMSVVCT